MNRALAEWRGWKHRLATHDNPVERHGMKLPNYFGDDIEAWCHDSMDGVYAEPPNYVADLNAIADPRAALDQAQRVAFLNALRAILAKRWKRPISDFDLVCAEAHEQAEAILRAIGKWVNE